MYRNPKIVIVIPAKNSEKYISKTIRSLKNQTIKPEQIIVVDDGSNDNTYKISVKNGAQVIQLKL
jgi:glycosyltransferase involved in cell wall biosynthesis